MQPLAASRLDVDPVLLRLQSLRLGLLRFSARLTDGSGPIAGGSVTFRTASGAFGCAATTNANGIASCSVVVPWLQALLSLGVRASFAGDATHTGSSGSAGLIK